MAEEIKDLIEKIQQEGVKVAEEKAKEIQSQAKNQSEAIIEKARLEAEKILAEAKQRINKMEEAAKASLQQTGRNLLISLRKEINSVLEKMLTSAVKQALSPAELAKILHSLISETAKHNKSDIIVSVNKDDLEKLEKSFLAELKEEVKKGISLKSSEDISAGFTISFDSAKSLFDFTDKALADYIVQYLKPKLAELLKSQT